MELELKEKIVDTFNKELKGNYIKNLIEGSEIAYTLILDNINKGYSLEQVKAFCELQLSPKGKETMRKVAGAKIINNN